jgi:ketose-bisphosphate aldolase
MLTGCLDAIHDAYRADSAVAAFSTYNLEMTSAILAAAESSGKPAILQAGSGAFRHAGRSALIAASIAAAREAATPVGVHLDHCRDIDEIRLCLDGGFTSVMFDGSHLPFAENVRLTKQAAGLAHDSGAYIEGELGTIDGDEDRSRVISGRSSWTDPDSAADFVAQTGVDLLAVSVGNVHGATDVEPVLQIELLRRIRETCPVPLVLHGASGLSDGQILSAINNGVAKVNINTELRSAFLAGLRDPRSTADDMSSGYARAIEGATALAEERIATFDSASRR